MKWDVLKVSMHAMPIPPALWALSARHVRFRRAGGPLEAAPSEFPPEVTS